MPLNLDQLLRNSQFSLKFDSLGPVRFRNPTTSQISRALIQLETPGFDGKSLARLLIAEMASRPEHEQFSDTDPIQGANLTPEELTLLTDDDLEHFAQRVVERHRYWTKKGDDGELTKSDGQSACDFLAQALRHGVAEERARMDRLVKSISKPLIAESTLASLQKSLDQSISKTLFAESTIVSLQKSLDSASRFQELIKSYEIGTSTADRILGEHARFGEIRGPQPIRVDLPIIQSSPVLETNKMLGQLTSQIQEMRPLVAQGAEMIRSMNETAMRLQADYVQNAARTDRQTRTATIVAAASLFVSAIGFIASTWFSIFSYADAKEASAKGDVQIKAFENKVNELVKSQGRGSDALIKSHRDDTQALIQSQREDRDAFIGALREVNAQSASLKK